MSNPIKAQLIKVLDSSTKESLPGTVIMSENPLQTISTDNRGQANIAVFKGIKRIQFRLLGYQTLILSYEEIQSLSFVVSLSESNTRLDQIVVSANRWTQPKNEVPFKIRSLNSKDIAFFAPQTTADMLAQTGEVFIQKSQQGGGSPMIRGFAANRLLISVDGVRMNTAISRSGNLQNIISIDPFSIEQTEVLFGPGSVMYGSDAIGGVMSFYSLRPLYSQNDSIRMEWNGSSRFASANNEIANHFDFKLGKKKWAWLLSASYTSFDDLLMGTKGPDEYLRNFSVERQNQTDIIVQNPNPLLQLGSAYNQENVLSKLAYKPNPYLEFIYAVHYSTTSNYGRYDRLIRTRKGKPRSAVWEYGPQEWLLNQLTIKHTKPNTLYDGFTVHLARQDFEESRIDRNFQDSILRTQTENVTAYSANFDLYKALGKGHSLFYGAEWVFNDVQSTGLETNVINQLSMPSGSRYPNSQWNSAALFLSWQKNVDEKRNYFAGLRYNYFSMQTDFSPSALSSTFNSQSDELTNSALTANAGVEWSLPKNWNVSAHISSAFRSPNVDDVGKFFDSQPGSVMIPNLDLGPEYAYTAEVDIHKRLGDQLNLDFVAYYTLLRDALVRRNSTLNGSDSIVFNGELSQVQSIQNAASAFVYGVEAKLEYQINRRWDFSSSLSYQKGEEELEDGSFSPLRHAPPMFGKTALRYAQKKMILEFFGLYSAALANENMAEEEKAKEHLYAIDQNGNPYSPSWYTLNFRGQFNLNKNLRLSAGIDNLTDQRYRTYSSALAGAGRSFILGIHLQGN